MQVNEARSNHKPGRIDHPFTVKRLLCYRGNRPACDTHVANSIQSTFRINHATTGQHKVISLLCSLQ